MSARFGPEVHVVLGLSMVDYDVRLNAARARGAGLDVSFDPNWHSHPALGITGHLHGSGRELHTHQPRTGWDHTPIPLETSGQSAGIEKGAPYE